MPGAGQAMQGILGEDGEGGEGPGPPVIAVCGSKAVGKSTFCRLLMNRMLARWAHVAFLDTDCGQPEFTVPGPYFPGPPLP